MGGDYPLPPSPFVPGIQEYRLLEKYGDAGAEAAGLREVG